MASSDELTAELLKYLPNVYFQPPSDITMTYPCIVYNKTGKNRSYGNNGVYKAMQEYSLTVIEHDPEGTTADELENDLEYCSIGQYFISDNLYHTVLTIYY